MTLHLHDAELLKSACLIGGAWVGDGRDLVVNPATQDVIGRVPHFGAVEAAEAVDAAARAFPGWSAALAKTRAAILRRWRDLIIEHLDDLAALLTAEQGKPLAEARAEIESGAAYIEYYAEETRRIAGETLPSHRADARIMVIRQAVGVVAAITPWNFPSSMIARKVAPALAAGCTVVVKPAPETPLSALALGELALRAGLPAGALNIVTGDAPAIGAVLTGHPEVRVVSFTGSTGVGRLLSAQAAPGVKKMALELGGNAPFIVFDDADLDLAVEGAMASKFRNAGQTCICANRIYVQAGIHDRFVAAFAAAARGIVVGDGAAEGVTQGPLIDARAIEKVERHLADALDKGASVVAGGGRHALGGTFFQPTVLTGVTAAMAVAREETFGPLAPIFRFETEDEVVSAANDTEYGLAAYVYARDVGRVFRLAERLQFGMVGVNAAAITTEIAPFGGVKQSGFGREGSQHGIDEYAERKYVLVGGLDR